MTSESSSNNDVLIARDPHELLGIFESAEDLPTLPEVAVRLQEVVDDPDSGAQNVADIIEQDPAIATRVLRMVNSVFYAPARGSEITHLQPAIARLGFVTVTNIALSTSIFKAFSRHQKPAFDRREFWRHSITVGIITTVLQDFCQDRIDQPITRDVAHLSGIVHDMGKILFERYANDEFHQAINSAKAADISVIKEEARFIGMGHDEAGSWLAGKWKLAQEIKDVIRWHHDPLSCPESDHQPLAKLVHMADYICHSQRLGESGNHAPTYDNRIREELALTPDRIAEIMDVVEEEASKSEVLLSLSE